MAATTPISALFEITPRYLRSTNLERDFTDPKAIEHYVLTQHGQECLARLAGGLQPTSTQRAWRLTGNYGSGKSSFALFLAHWCAGNAVQLSRALHVDVKYDRFALNARPRYVPLLVTGSREPMGMAIMRSLARVLDEHHQRGVKSLLQKRIENVVERGERVSDNDVIASIQATNEKLIRDGKCRGMLVLLDELGKFLEYAAYHPEAQDVYLLQKLAEAAAASGQTAPLFIVGLLHQGFDVYAGSLDPSAQREWEKVAGRFDEILFNQPLVQVAGLIGAALRVRTASLPAFAKEEARAAFSQAVELGWFGRDVSKSTAADLAARVYPLHATVLPVLVRAFSRFGQNERSLFSFLLSDEPFALRQFAERALAPGNLYRLPQFYDFIRTNFGHRLALQSYRSHWTHIESMVESFATSVPLELEIVKTIGILNLLDAPDLLPTEEALLAALGGAGGHSAEAIKNALKGLHKHRGVLYRRGVSGAFCLWPHTSVDLEAAYDRATKTIGQVSNVGAKLREFLETRPLVARRHYIQTGNLRYFDIRYAPIDELETAARDASDADGSILVALCETPAECTRAEVLVKSEAIRTRGNLMLAIPTEPLAHQAGLVAEALRWEWVALNTPELNADRFAREEVSRQKTVARQRLERRIQDLIGLRALSGAMALKWFRGARALKIDNGRQLLERISDLCDELYPQAPRVPNELVNRRALSSAAATARMRLIERLLSQANEPYLGMDPAKKPPEMSMYLSVLHAARIHVETDDGWKLRIPDPRKDPLNVGPVLREIRAFLEHHGDRRVKVSDLFTHLAKPPFGVRDGLVSIFLAIYTALHAQEIAFYEEGTFLKDVKGDEFLRLSKVPDSFEIQLCRVDGLRAKVFKSLLRALEIKPTRDHHAHVLDVVRPLCQFVARLPDYARTTQRLSSEARAVRDVILAAREPVRVLFHDLPNACGMAPFSLDGHVAPAKAHDFANQLKAHLAALGSSFDDLLHRMRAGITEAFSVGGEFSDARAALALRAAPLVVCATEPRVKAFCLRLSDTQLSEAAWLESVGNLLALQPPSRWRDSDEDTFLHELTVLAARFKSLESISFAKGRNLDMAEAFRVSLTKEDGSEVQEVVFIEKSKVADVESLVHAIEELIRRDRQVGIAALSRVVWTSLNKG